MNVVKFGDLGRQVVLVSALAFERIKFVGYDAAIAAKYLDTAVYRDQAAAKRYEDLEQDERERGTVIGDLLGDDWRSHYEKFSK
jgi:hypothetical protein